MKKKLILVISAILVIAMLTCSLAACDLFGGGDKDKKPVKTYDNPYDFFQALSIAKDWTLIAYEVSDTPVIQSVNAKGEFIDTDGMMIAKYVGEDLWVWKMNNDIDSWEKAKVSETNSEYLEVLNMFREMGSEVSGYTKEDFVKQGDNWYEKKDGVINERLYYTLEKNIMTAWWIEENGETTKQQDLILEANITLPDDAKNAETVTEQELFCRYNNPAQFWNDYIIADDWSMAMYDTAGRTIVNFAMTQIGDLYAYLPDDEGFVHKVVAKVDGSKVTIYEKVDNEPWKKAIMDKNHEKYKEMYEAVYYSIGHIQFDEDDFYYEDGYWYQEYQGHIAGAYIEMTNTCMSIYSGLIGNLQLAIEYKQESNITLPKEALNAIEISADDIF